MSNDFGFFVLIYVHAKTNKTFTRLNFLVFLELLNFEC